MVDDHVCFQPKATDVIDDSLLVGDVVGSLVMWLMIMFCFQPKAAEPACVPM